ncbi:MAG: ATPase, partial [Saprospiraceae bacterium]|nr:ATPase [Saprospiraceae bacterium]
AFQQFLDMIVDTRDVYEDDISPKLKLTQAELNDWSTRIDQVEVPAEVLNTIQILKVKLNEYNNNPNHGDQKILVFDRRWKKIVRLLRTSAFLNGRAKADLMDCFLIMHCLWNKPAQLDILREMIQEAVRKHGYTLAVNLRIIKQEVADFEEDVHQEIRVKHVLTEEVPLLLNEAYFEVLNDDNQFEGNHINTKQWRGLRMDEFQVTNFYDQDMNLRNRLKARRGRNQHTIDIEYNSEVKTYRIRTKQAEKTEVIFKKPHPVVAKHWDERYARLVAYIGTKQKHIKNDAPAELADVDQNLFVDSAFGETVRRNMDEVKDALQSLLLRLEKIQYDYASLEN